MKDVVHVITPLGQEPGKLWGPVAAARHYWQYRELVRQLAWREVVGRYTGSYLGMTWSLIHPLLMLAIYTFVFTVIFRAKWGTGPIEDRGMYAIVLFSGMITYNIFSEVVTVAPNIILTNANYVKKVIFPLEILPLVKGVSSLVNGFINLIVLLFVMVLLRQSVPWTILIIPLAWFPLILFTIGFGLFLASLGVFIRDIGQFIVVFVTMLFFLSPILYPVEAIPPSFQKLCYLNPITVFVQDARRVTIFGQLPDWPMTGLVLLLSATIFTAGFAWFMKSKKGFVDVL